MTSVAPSAAGFKQSNGYFVAIADVTPFAYDIAPGTGSGGSYRVGTIVATTLTGIPTAAGTVFRDMGKSVVSSARTFRKVQLTGTGVDGTEGGWYTGTGTNSPSTTVFYLEVGSGMMGPNDPAALAPVAYYPSVL